MPMMLPMATGAPDANPGETIEDILSPQELESLRRSYDDERHDTLPLQLAVVAVVTPPASMSS
jgi:hypothetical protein